MEVGSGVIDEDLKIDVEEVMALGPLEGLMVAASSHPTAH